MKKCIVIIACAFFVSCTQSPSSGGDAVRRDSINEPIPPLDTAAERLDPGAVSDTPEVSF